MDDPRNRLKVVDEFGTDLDRARGTVLRPPSAVSLYGACQEVRQGGASFSFVGFFVRSESPFLRPDPAVR